jgi:hypothetical protein
VSKSKDYNIQTNKLSHTEGRLEDIYEQDVDGNIFYVRERKH